MSTRASAQSHAVETSNSPRNSSSGTDEGAINQRTTHDLERKISSDETVSENHTTGDVEKAITSDPDPNFLVNWDGDDDPDNPKNWSRAVRWYYTSLAGMLALCPSFASSAPTGIISVLRENFGFSEEVGSLLVALFVGGYCVGPLLWGPLSETYGRRPNFIVSFIGFTAFQVGCALSNNTASILIFRFLTGAFGVSPLTNSGALMGDIWDVKTRGNALSLFTVAPLAGPALAPMVSGFIKVTNTNWRWVFWSMAIWNGVCLILVFFTLPETFPPVILKHKAERKRKETGDDRWYAPMEAVKISPSERVKDIVVKPWKIFIQEPMLMAIHTYMAFQYGVLYLLFEAYPIVFAEGHGFNEGITGLMFMPLFVGGVFNCLVVIFYFNPKYIADVEKAAPNPVAPERRLPMAVLGSFCFMISFWWFGWTSYPTLSYWGPMTSGAAQSFGVSLNFLALQSYIIDTYLQVAASALATNVVLRSTFGAGFPLFARQMFVKLNPRWASTLLGFIALLLMPIPLLFMRFGPALRAKSRYSPTGKK